MDENVVWARVGYAASTPVDKTPCYLMTGLADDLAAGDPISTWQGYSCCVLCGAREPTSEDDHYDFCVWRAAQTWHQALFGQEA